MNASKRYKDIEMPFTCPETGRIFTHTRGLSIYITKTLRITQKEYYDKHINHKDNSCYFCGNKGKFISVTKGYRNLCEDNLCIKKSFNSFSVEGVMYRELCSREEAEKIFLIDKNKKELSQKKTIEKIKETNPDYDKQRSRNCKEFWIKKGYSEEESLLKVKEVMNEIHKKTFKKFKDNPDKYAAKYNNKIEYWLEKGYSEEESLKKVSERQTTFSKEICIEKYGELEGYKIWKERQNKWINTLDSKSDEEKMEINRKKLFNNSGYSKISQKLFWSIYNIFINNDIKFEELNGEVIRYDKINNKHYRYDYVDFTNKKVIEFNGDFWHCNPNFYMETHVHKIMNITTKELWKKDKIKNNWIKNRNYQVLVVWESEYKKYPQQTLEKCIEFINKK
jgi:hypothetical protein